MFALLGMHQCFLLDSLPLWGTSWDCVVILRSAHAVYKCTRNHTAQIPHVQCVSACTLPVVPEEMLLTIFNICKDCIKLVIICVCVFRTIRSFMMQWRMGNQRHSSNSELLLAHYTKCLYILRWYMLRRYTFYNIKWKLYQAYLCYIMFLQVYSIIFIIWPLGCSNVWITSNWIAIGAFNPLKSSKPMIVA